MNVGKNTKEIFAIFPILCTCSVKLKTELRVVLDASRLCITFGLKGVIQILLEDSGS